MSVTIADINRLSWELGKLKELYGKKHSIKSVVGYVAPFVNYTGKQANIGILDDYVTRCSNVIKSGDVSKIQNIFNDLEDEFAKRAKEIYLKDHPKKKSDEVLPNDYISYFIIEKLNKEPGYHFFYRGIGTILINLPARLKPPHAELFKKLLPTRSLQEALDTPQQVMPSTQVTPAPPSQVIPLLAKIAIQQSSLQAKITKNKEDKVSIGKDAVLEKSKLYLEAGEKFKNKQIDSAAFLQAKDDLEACIRDNFIYYTATRKSMSETENIVEQVLAENKPLYKSVSQKHEVKEVKASGEQALYHFTIRNKDKYDLTFSMKLLKAIVHDKSFYASNAKSRAQSKLYDLAKDIVYGERALSQEKLNYLEKMFLQYDDVYVRHINKVGISKTGSCIAKIIAFAEGSLKNSQKKKNEVLAPAVPDAESRGDDLQPLTKTDAAAADLAPDIGEPSVNLVTTESPIHDPKVLADTKQQTETQSSPRVPTTETGRASVTGQFGKHDASTSTPTLSTADTPQGNSVTYHVKK